MFFQRVTLFGLDYLEHPPYKSCIKLVVTVEMLTYKNECINKKPEIWIPPITAVKSENSVVKTIHRWLWK